MKEILSLIFYGIYNFHKQRLFSVNRFGFQEGKKGVFRRNYKIVISNKMLHSPNDTSGTLFQSAVGGNLIKVRIIICILDMQKHFEKSFEYEN